MTEKTRVEVDFRGLCMFVPGQDGEGNSVLHVLMPKTGADMGEMPDMPVPHRGHGSMSLRADPVIQHVPRVVYSVDYEASENASMPVVNGFVTTVLRVIDLKGCPVIDWSKMGTATMQPVALPSDIVSVTDLAEQDLGLGDPGAAVKAALIAEGTLPPAERCAARITLPGTVTITPYNVRNLKFSPTGAWQGNGGEVPPAAEPHDVAACTLCVFEISRPTLDLPLPGAHDLVGSGAVIRVMFGNTIPGDYQHPPLVFDPKGQTHFGAFYGLLNNPPPAPRVPEAPHLDSPGSTSCMTCSARTG